MWRPDPAPSGYDPLDLVMDCGGSRQCPPDRLSYPVPGPATQLWDSGPYEYDGAGNVAQIGLHSYGYDKLNRLVGATINHLNGQYALTYDYDPYGNMTMRIKWLVGSWTQAQNFTVSPESNRLASETGANPKAYEYDPNGNVTRTGDLWHVFDERNRLVEVWGPGNRLISSYDYDASGYRVRSLVDGIETFYVRDDAGAVLSEFRRAAANSNQAAVWDKDYIYALGQAVTLVKNENPSPMTRPWASMISNDGMFLNWNAVEDEDVAGYHIVRTTTPAGGEAEFRVDSPATSFADDFGDFVVDSNTSVYYTVEAIDTAENHGPASPKLRINYNGQPPLTPTNLAAEPLDRAVRLTWTPVAVGGDIWGYKIERKTGAGAYQLITPVPVQTAFYHDVELMNGTTYEYRVWTVDTYGLASDKTAPVAATPRDFIAPGRPSGVQASPGFVPYSIVVRWNPVADYDIDEYIINRTGCGTSAVQFPPVSAPTTSFEDVVPSADVDCTYTVTAADTSVPPNVSEASFPSTARARTGLANGPVLRGAAFDVVDPCDLPDACPASSTCDVAESDAGEIGVRITWDPSQDAGVHGSITKYRIYRATGTTGQFVPIRDVPRTAEVPNPVEHFDTERNGHDYTYQVAVFALTQTGEHEFLMPCELPSCDPDSLHVVDPDYNSDTAVRSIMAVDGHDLYPTANARSRSVTVYWSRVLESKLVGYHVYRRCTWSLCPSALGSLPSMDTHACEDAWVRLTETPVTTRSFEDGTTGGLNGCFAYAVRPVGPDGEEGRLQIALRVYAGTAGDPMWCFGMSQIETGWPNRSMGPIENELDRVNSIERGTWSDDGAPPPPAAVVVDFATKYAFDNPYWTKVAHVGWGYPDPPRDLAGYHVEMAGSVDGPWQRLTKHPVAWWENEYVVKGLGVKIWSLPACVPGEYCDQDADGNYTGHVECAHFRVIAVDEDANESEPTPGYGGYPRPECPLGTTPPAPTGLVASTATNVTGSPCATLLQWNEVDYVGQDPALFEYHLHRMTFADNVTFFYVTHFQAGDDDDCSDNACCVNGVCSFVERGGDGGKSLDPETDCALINTADPEIWNSRCRTSNLEAYYVTVKGPTGGESPRSQVVFWDCRANPGYARLETCPVDEEETILVADSVVGAEVCESDPSGGDTDIDVARAETNSPAAVSAPFARPALTPAVPAIAGLLKLGQTSGGPPFKLIDLHVDHLGSTRVTTDEQGTVVTLHDYFPFGEEIVPIPDDSTKLFTGHERDRETGLDYMMARYYGSSLARFLSTDPGDDTYLDVPQSWNKYSYVRNNPINTTDPTGAIAETPFDVAMAVVSVGQAIAAPTPGNIIGAVLDVAAVVVPGVPAVGGRAIDAAQAGNKLIDAANAADTAADAGKATGTAADYSKVADPATGAKVGGDFTQRQKGEVLGANRDANSGTLRSDKSGTELVPATQSQKGVKHDPNEAHVDHKASKADGGTNSSSNAQVLSRKENLEKGRKSE